MQHYSVFFISQFNFIVCDCQTPGSTSNTCSNDGRCTCNIGYEGDKCSECTNEYYKTQAGCSGTIVMVGLMCFSKLLAGFCMIHKILGSVSCCLFGNILEITVHCFWEHLQMVISRLHVSIYFMMLISTFSHIQSVILLYSFSFSFSYSHQIVFVNFNVKSSARCRNCL